MEKLSHSPKHKTEPLTQTIRSPITVAVLASVAAVLAPQNADAKPPRQLMLRHAPQTSYVDPAQTFESVGRNRPRTFEVTNAKPLTFYVSGPANVTLRLTNKSHQHVQRPIKAKVFVDGTEYQLRHPLKKQTVDIGPISVPEGVHEIKVETDEAHEYFASLSGAAEVETPGVLDAYQIPWTDDPSMPDRFETACHSHEDTDPGATAGLDFKFLDDDAPVELGDKKDGKFAYDITRSPESTRVSVTLTDADGIVYTSASFEPDEDQMCDLERTVPPAQSTDYTAPEQIALHVSPQLDPNTGTVSLPNPPKQESGLALPKGMECKVVNSQSELPQTSRLFCWQKVKGLIRAWRARITSKTVSGNTTDFRYILDEY